VKYFKSNQILNNFRIIWKVLNTDECNFDCDYCLNERRKDYKNLPAIVKNIDYFKFFNKVSENFDKLILDFYGGDGDKKLSLIEEADKKLSDKFTTFSISTNFWFDNNFLKKLIET